MRVVAASPTRATPDRLAAALPGAHSGRGRRDRPAAPGRTGRRRRAAGSICSSTTRAISGRARCRPLRDHPLPALRTVLETNVLAPLALSRRCCRALRACGGTVVDVSSDAAVTPYAGWGGYGASKAALDHLSAVLAVEEPGVRVYAVDPGDMRTAMHQAGVPGRGHLRSAGTRVDRSGVDATARERAARRAAATWPPTGQWSRERRDEQGTAGPRALTFDLPPGSRPTRHRRAATGCACWWPRRRECGTVTSTSWQAFLSSRAT